MKKELLSIMFLLGVSIALVNITPEINQTDSAALQLKENKDINLGINENKKFENSGTPVTFDIIRISQDGDAIMAGKSEPNLEIFLFENKKKISSFFSDANGEWVWISDNPLTEGLKIFNIRCFNEAGKESESSQEIYVLGDKKSSSKPIVLKVDSRNLDDINIYNTEYIDNSLTLDILNYYPKKKLTISGRAPVGTDVNVYANDILLGSVSSDFYGNWNFSSREIVNIDTSNLKLSATIASIKLHIDLPLSLSQLEQNILKTSSINIIKENNSWRLTRKISDDNYLYSEIFIKNSKSLSISQLLNSKKTYNLFDSKILK
jgi:hypothetical protein